MQVADQLNLNYSTAKTLIRRFKTRGHKLNHEFIIGCSLWFDIYELQTRKRCTYISINHPEKTKPNDKKERAKLPLNSDNSQDISSEITKMPPRPTYVTLLQQVLFTEWFNTHNLLIKPSGQPIAHSYIIHFKAGLLIICLRPILLRIVIKFISQNINIHLHGHSLRIRLELLKNYLALFVSCFNMLINSGLVKGWF